MKEKSRFSLIFACVLFAGVTGYGKASPMQLLLVPPPSVKCPNQADSGDMNLESVFKKLAKVFAAMDPNKASYTCKGQISVKSKTDSLENMNNLPFVLSKNKSDFYYRLNRQEVINEGEVNLNINHITKHIFLTKRKQVGNFDPFELSQIKNVLKAQKYAIRLVKKGPLQSIVFTNELSRVCRYYQITFDTLSYQVKRIVMRVPNAIDAANKNNDKQIDIHFTQWGGTGNPEIYARPSTYLDKANRLLPGFRNYTLTHL